MTADDTFGRLDDDDYPAYTMGRAAELLGATPAFLRPRRSPPDHPPALRRRPPPLLPLPTAYRRPRPGTRRSGYPHRGCLPDRHPRRPARGSPAHQRRISSRRRISEPDGSRMRWACPSVPAGIARTVSVCGVILSSG